jgi:hypothetical protein
VAKVEAKHLLVYIAVKMDRLYRDVCPVQSTLEARPEVLDSVRVDVLSDVAFDVVDDLVVVRGGYEGIGRVLIGDDVRTGLYIAVCRR